MNPRLLPSPIRLAMNFLRLSVLFILLFCLAGCGTPARGEGGPVELRAWTMWGGEEAEAFQVVVDAFNRGHPHIRVHNLAAVDDTKIIRAIVANDPPDLFTLRDPGYLGSLAGNGALLPLDDRFRRSGLNEAEFAPGSLTQCRYRDRLYAMVFLMDCWGLLYRPETLAEAGIEGGRPPRTFEEVLEYARKLTLRDASGHIRRIGMAPPDPLVVIGAFGGQFIDPETGKPTADHPRNVAALEWYRKLIEVQGGAQEVNAFAAGFGQEMGINNPFLLGKVAMMLNGQWNPYWFQRYGPDVRYRAAPVPHPAAQPELERPTWLGGNLFCIPANSRHHDEAWEFLRWTQTPEAQHLFAERMHGIPNLLSARRDPGLREVRSPDDRWKEAYSIFMDAATSPNARHFPVTPITGLYQYELTTAADYVRFGSRSPEEALRDVQRRVEREMVRWQP